ncbi:MAG: molybdopterin-containing oxidoreductase family protein [Coriobacteriales bacterium]|jgi:anaerobic selenocysteine-containing dehydrogenase
MSEESFVYTACPGWGDHEYCALKTIVKDGKIVRCEHVDYTGPEAGEGYICQKGIAAARQPYNKDRLLYPLKRAGERGEGKWERISWDQALDEIAEKMQKIADEVGPEGVAFWSLAASVPPTYGLGGILTARFVQAWGAADPVTAYGIDNGPLYASFFSFRNPGMYMLTSPYNFDSSKYLIVWGANPIENQQRITNHLVEARTRGAKIVDIGLIYDGTAGFADWFIPVKPGSDPCLALGLARIIVENNWQDNDWLMANTNLPFLIRNDNGQLYRDADGNYMVWDADAGKPAPTTPGVKELPIEHAAFEGTFNIDGVEVHTGFTGLKEELSRYTLDYVSETTGVPKEDITKLADEYAHAGDAYILGALGLRYQNQGESYRSFFLLGALMGYFGRPGAGVTTALMPTEYPAAFNDTPIVEPYGPGNGKGKFIKLVDWFDGVQEGKYKGFIKMSGNPVHNCPNRGRWVNDVFPKLDLIVDFDIWMTDTGEYADYVLPDCMPFEREEIIASACYNHVVLQEPAIEPRGEARNANYFLSGLAKRLGIGDLFDKTDDEWLELRLKTDYPLISMIDPPLTLERLKKEKMVRMAAPPEPKFDPLALPFATKSARMEVYCEDLYDLGHGFSTFEPPYEAPGVTKNDKYPYQFFSGRQRFFMQSMYTDDPLMQEMSGGMPTIRINPVDAKAKSITDGEKIEVFNDRGHMVAPARLDEAVPPGTIQAWFGWRHKHYEDGMYSELLLPLSGHESDNALAKRWWDIYRAENEPASAYAGQLSVATGSWDTTWDCACDVRKVSDRKEA